MVSSSFDFSSAGFFSQTGSELRDEEGKTKSDGIFLTLLEALADPGVAGSVEFNIRLTMLGADSRTENTTIVMIIQNMLVRTNLATRRQIESDGVLLTTSSTSRDLVGNLNRLEPHSVVGAVSLVALEDLLIHRSE